MKPCPSIRHVLTLSIVALSVECSAQRTPFTYQDMLLLDRISGLEVDPAGNRALYAVRGTDMEKNRGVRSLWLKDLANTDAPAARLAVGDSGAFDAQWSADGKSIYFLCGKNKEGVAQLYRTDASGNPMQQLTRLPLDIGAYRVTNDGAGAVVSLAVFPGNGDEVARTVERNGVRAMGSGNLYDRVFVRHWDTWADGTRNHLFHVRFSDGAITALTPGFDGDVPGKPFGDNGDFLISPDGKTVYFSAREAGRTEPWSTNFDIYGVAVTGGALKNLTATNEAWDAAPRLSPDGKTLAYKAMKRTGFEADRFEVQLLDLATGTVRPVATSWDRSVEQMQWSNDGKSLYVTADDQGAHRLFRIGIDPKKSGVVQLSKSGHIDAFHETGKGFVFLKSAMNSPSQLFAAKPGAAVVDEGAMKLTTVNAGLADKVFGAYEQFTFPGWNNETVHGYVVNPSDYVEGKRYPVVFLIHGGPQGSFGDMWSYRWNAQTYAGAGYGVVMIDFHGSTGYGQAFCDAISEHWGDRPLEDLQKGWAHALKSYPFLDGDRAAALGASYGGYMVNWIAGRWKEPWKALVSHCGVFDSRSMGYSTEELWFSDWENGGSSFKHPEKADVFNPALFVKDWSVPMLVIHGDLDFRIPITQGISAFTALQEKGVPSQFLRFPDENHWVLKPRNSMQWHNTVFGWLDQHIGGGPR
ncbi:MAG: S9 family peptidase [Flavobacteriales bacterium]|nr:MAG: S9 family peptidase [Flavobacteriales bacterium]